MRMSPFFFIAVSAITFAQERPPIATDRPGFSDGSNLVAPGVFQLEMGFFRTQIGSSISASVGDGLLRYGMNQRFELRLIGISYGLSTGAKQWLDPSVGFKARLAQTSKAEVTLIGQTTLPVGEGDLRANEWNPTLKLAATTSLGKDTFGGNLAIARLGSGTGRFDQAALSLFLARPMNGANTLTGEVWVVDRVSRGSRGAGFASIAISHLLDNDRQLDLRLGSGLNQSRDGWFLQGGFSVRF